MPRDDSVPQDFEEFMVGQEDRKLIREQGNSWSLIQILIQSETQVSDGSSINGNFVSLLQYANEPDYNTKSLIKIPMKSEKPI